MEYTVRQLADLAQVSKPTISAAIKDLGVQSVYVKGKTKYYDEAAAATVMQRICPFAHFPQGVQSVEKSQSDCKESAKCVQNEDAKLAKDAKSLNQTIEVQGKTIDLLAAQLAEKDRQIEALQAQLSTALQLSSVLQLREAERRSAETEKPGFFRRLFAKRSGIGV